MYKLIVMTALTTTVLLLGCSTVHTEEPVAQQKSVRAVTSLGRQLLDAARKHNGRDITYYLKDIDEAVDAGNFFLREDHFRRLVNIIVDGGEPAIYHFKLAKINRVFKKLENTNYQIGHRLNDLFYNLDFRDREKFDRLVEKDPAKAAAFLRKANLLPNIDEIKRSHARLYPGARFTRKDMQPEIDEIKRLAEDQGETVDLLIRTVIANHKLAEAVTVDLEYRGILRRFELSSEAVSQELKVDLTYADLQGKVASLTDENITVNNRTTVDFTFLEAFSGVDLDQKEEILRTLLTRGEDGKHLYRSLSAEEIEEIGWPLGLVFDKKIISLHPKYELEHMRHYHAHLREFIRD